MKGLTGILVAAGCALFAYILYRTDLAEVLSQVERLSWWGIGLIAGIQLVAVSADVLAWLVTFRLLPLTLPWFFRLLRVHVIGDALNNVTPGAPVGGEPVKAKILNQRYRVGYHETAATWVLMQTILIGAQVVFLVIGIGIAVAGGALPPAYETVGMIALTAIAGGLVLFFLAQRYRLLSRIGVVLGRGSRGVRLLDAVRHVRHVEGRIIRFYLQRPLRFAGATALEFVNWMMGAVDVYVIMALLGWPISFAEAWVIEGGVLLVRTAVFLLPASIGLQEGVFLVLCQAVTGSPTVGVAVALIRRFRELAQILLGLALGGHLSLSRVTANAASRPDRDRRLGRRPEPPADAG